MKEACNLPSNQKHQYQESKIHMPVEVKEYNWQYAQEVL